MEIKDTVEFFQDARGGETISCSYMLYFVARIDREAIEKATDRRLGTTTKRVVRPATHDFFIRVIECAIWSRRVLNE